MCPSISKDNAAGINFSLSVCCSIFRSQSSTKKRRNRLVASCHLTPSTFPSHPLYHSSAADQRRIPASVDYQDSRRYPMFPTYFDVCTTQHNTNPASNPNPVLLSSTHKGSTKTAAQDVPRCEDNRKDQENKSHTVKSCTKE